MKNIFLSYAYVDNEVATKFAQALSSVGLTVFYGEQISAGDNWINTINKQLEASDVLIVLVSKEALDSSWVHMEVGAAWARNKMVIPVLFPGIDFADLTIPMASFQGIKVSSLDNLDSTIEEISRAVSNK